MNQSSYPTRLHHPDPIVRAHALSDLVAEYRDEFRSIGSGDFRDWIVERLRLPMGGKTIDRYLGLLKTPEVVQRAVSTGQLSRTLAYRVAIMPPDVQQEIAERIDAEEDAKQVVLDVMHRRTGSSLPTPGTPAAEYRKLLVTADRTLAAVEGHEEEIVEQAMSSEEAAEILDRLADFAARMKREEVEAFVTGVESWRSRIRGG